MEDLDNAIAGLDGPIFLGIVGGLAAIFLLVIAFDSWRRKRKRARSRVDAGRSPGFFRRMRNLYYEARQEVHRRRRINHRNRTGEK
jgi:hypothetical protein